MKSRLALSAIIGLAAADLFTAVGPDGTLSAQRVKSQWDGVYTSEQAKRGQVLYDDQCSSCHGAELLFTFVLSGTATLHIEGRTPEPLAAGDSFVIPAELQYSLAGCSSDLEFLEVSLPGVFETRLH